MRWRVKKREGARILWSYKTQELRVAESIDGKWLVLSTDDALDANEVVNEYL